MEDLEVTYMDVSATGGLIVSKEYSISYRAIWIRL
jgi:hypothetical protein